MFYLASLRITEPHRKETHLFGWVAIIVGDQEMATDLLLWFSGDVTVHKSGLMDGWMVGRQSAPDIITVASVLLYSQSMISSIPWDGRIFNKYP